MVRIKRGKTARKRRKYLFQYTKGFRWGRKSKYRAAKEAMLHAWTHAYRGRKERKRIFRKLWQSQINAFVRLFGLKYSQFINLLKEKKIDLDRKILSQLAREKPKIFEKIIEKIKEK